MSPATRKDPTMPTTTCTTCHTSHDSGMDETVAACPACPAATSTLAQDRADIAADKLERLAADLYAASLPEGDGFHGMPAMAVARTISDSRNEAAGALERLAENIVADGPRGTATGFRLEAITQRNTLRDASAKSYMYEPGLLRSWAAAWRAFSSGAS